MKKEDINVTSTHISLLVGDTIVGSTGTQYKVVDIDYGTGMLTIRVNFSNYNITFDAIAIGDYKKVLEDTNIIQTTNGDISLKTGDAIINNGRLLKVTTVAYDSGLVDINENGDEYTISLADIDTVLRIDSVTQIVTTNPRKNRLIIIANGLNSHSCVKEDEDIEFENIYTVRATISLEVGDVITDRTRNKYNVDAIEYDNAMVFCSKDDESYTFPFVAFTEGNYMKVVNSTVKGVTDDYPASVDSSLRVGNEIIDANGDRYKVTMVDYNNSSITAVSEDGEELSFSFYGFACSDYKKVLNSSVKECKDNYVAVDDNSPKIGDEITGAEGNKYKVVCIDYNDCTVTVKSTDGEEFEFNLDVFGSSVYKKVLK